MIGAITVEALVLADVPLVHEAPLAPLGGVVGVLGQGPAAVVAFDLL